MQAADAGSELVCELIVTSGVLAGQRLSLQAGQSILVGRAVEGGFVVADDSSMSRSHFLALREAKGLFVRDLQSRNGTFVNGCEVVYREIHDGDEVLAGRTLFRVRYPTSRVDRSHDRAINDCETVNGDSAMTFVPKERRRVHDITATHVTR